MIVKSYFTKIMIRNAYTLHKLLLLSRPGMTTLGQIDDGHSGVVVLLPHCPTHIRGINVGVGFKSVIHPPHHPIWTFRRSV